MTAAETGLFECFLRTAGSYAEFGSGGSTYLASSLVRGSITTLDSSEDWLRQVADACAGQVDRVKPRLIHVDIGPTGAWGAPTDQSCRHMWPRYSTDMWADEDTEQADLFLVDGRFRVACFIETMMRCRDDAIVLFHDFTHRPQYHAAFELGRRIAFADELAVFVRRSDFSYGRARRLLDEYRFDPA